MYNTELMQKILTSEQGRKAVNRVTHKYGDAEIMLHLFQCIGLEFDKHIGLTESVVSEVVPDTATWSISIWEGMVGLNPDDSLTLEERRQRIKDKRTIRSPQNPSILEAILSNHVHANVRITENLGKNRFGVYIDGISSVRYIEEAKKKLSEIKQAHMTYNLQCALKSTEVYLYTGGFIQKYKVITLPVYDAVRRTYVRGALSTCGVVQKCKVMTLKEA
ncbi:MAG: DUF2313 domain-containing protein [bacterium]|nr:DUF2313 domain-containing protein [bacterium]